MLCATNSNLQHSYCNNSLHATLLFLIRETLKSGTFPGTDLARNRSFKMRVLPRNWGRLVTLLQQVRYWLFRTLPPNISLFFVVIVLAATVLTDSSFNRLIHLDPGHRLETVRAESRCLDPLTGSGCPPASLLRVFLTEDVSDGCLWFPTWGLEGPGCKSVPSEE